MEDKYIDLLLNRCLNFDNSKILFISYDVINKSFVDKVKVKAKELGVEEIIEDINDIYELRDKLLNISLEDIKTDSYFDKSIWDKYALKGASFLMLDTEFPHILDDVELKKISLANFTKRKSRPIFSKKECNYEIPWCIAALPNEIWAKEIFDCENAYQKLEDSIYKMCMIDKDNPIKSWENFLKSSKQKTNYLNSLEITKLHYTNELGTNLTVEYPSNVIWSSVADDLEHNMLVNMPSYEIFTSPDYRKTNGIVYSSKKLMYGGGVIDEFYLEFKNGKVVDFNAKVGYELLKGIIESDSNSCYLGETALVDYNSPISDTHLVFGTTLIDENASCHLALGDGFGLCLKDGINMTKKELLSNGINQSLNHVDFMIGTKFTNIEAYTNKGKILIFKDGNFII